MGVQDITTAVDRLVSQANSTVVVKVFEALKQQHITDANHGENCGCKTCEIVLQYRRDVKRLNGLRKRHEEEVEHFFGENRPRVSGYFIDYLKDKEGSALNEFRKRRRELKEKKNFDLDSVL